MPSNLQKSEKPSYYAAMFGGSSYDGVGLQISRRRRRWTAEEKVRIVAETYLPGNTVALVAERHRIANNQLFTWRRLAAQGVDIVDKTVVPISEYRAAQQQIRELQRLLGRTMLEVEKLRNVVGANHYKTSFCVGFDPKDGAMSSEPT